MLHNRLSLIATASCCLAVTTAAFAQKAPEKPMSGKDITAAAGNSAPDASGMANLSPAINKKAIDKAIRTVADWQLVNAKGKFNQDWTYAPLYLGLLAATDATGDKKYHDAVLADAQRYEWKLWNNRPLHADDEAIGQSYEKLYAEKKDPARIADTRATFDRLVDYRDNLDKDLWWWCDALFMAPTGLVKMSVITGDHKYIDAMDREWSLTQNHLYDPKQKLFYRDATYFGKHEANGENIYWTRGNGWVLAGTANVLKAMPKNDPLRPKYEALFKDMAARIAELQQPDGLWKPSLLDPTHYPLPEISGSAFFAYGLTWGVNNGLLDRKTYGPVIEKAWAGMLQHVYADGRLGCIQPIGAAPGAFTETSSYVYGVGAFLMTAEELKHYAR
ncbi:Rhamnogalacturonyl hydrolase YesR [Bryocella elongata]|uniref:Rhamnogalacturonyl hydrolase YesR n=1 Tax=Bryocella elongata TaxID=863522 RepID=A0A1H6C2A5_9BACT|nr:glycoside hydrolase family 88 protein [Bryocella elongata]SEG67104.1 Rhamnogalacturonyl hydrolase YesR [Bryocella elongata]